MPWPMLSTGSGINGASSGRREVCGGRRRLEPPRSGRRDWKRRPVLGDVNSHGRATRLFCLYLNPCARALGKLNLNVAQRQKVAVVTAQRLAESSTFPPSVDRFSVKSPAGRHSFCVLRNRSILGRVWLLRAMGLPWVALLSLPLTTDHGCLFCASRSPGLPLPG